MDGEQIRQIQSDVLAKMRAGAFTARGQKCDLHNDDRMNKTEARYASHLLIRQTQGAIIWFGFQCINLRIAKRCWYKPDFLVVNADGEFEIHEVKGHMEDDAAVKLRAFAEQYPMFKLFLVRRGKKRWNIEERTR